MFSGEYNRRTGHEPARGQVEWLKFRRDLASDIARAAQEIAVKRINVDPILAVLLDRIVECGPALDPAILSYLRKVAALRLRGINDVLVEAMYESEFFRMAIHSLTSELIELEKLVDTSGIPDEWDIAYELLLDLESGSDG